MRCNPANTSLKRVTVNKTVISTNCHIVNYEELILSFTVEVNVFLKHTVYNVCVQKCIYQQIIILVSICIAPTELRYNPYIYHYILGPTIELDALLNL